MIRVCLVAPAYMTGGQAVEARTLLTGFSAVSGVEFDLQPIDPRIPDVFTRMRGVRTLIRLPLFYVGLIRRVLKADVVHVFTAAFWPFLLTTTPAILISRILRRPVILNYRDGRARDHIRYRGVRWILRRASVLVFPSDFLKDVFAEFGLIGHVVPNVVDTERFPFRERVPLRPVLLSCRLLEELYAVDNTVAAFELLKHRVPDAQLLIVGDGDQRAALEALVAEREIKGVQFVGRVPHESMGEWFDRADIMVNSSRIDNMPHCLIEAFSAGLPIVTTGAGGIPYVVEDGVTARIVPADDPAAMAAAVGTLLDHPHSAQALIAAGRQRCDELYSWSAASSQWQRHYMAFASKLRDVAASIPQEARSA